MKKAFDEKKEKNQLMRNKIYFFFATSIFIFALDHALKIFSAQLSCASVFCLKYVVNRGAVFSLLSGFSWTRYLLIAIALIILVLIAFIYFKLKNKSLLLKISLPLIFAGTLSNMLDRVVFGYVVDYIPFFSQGLTFNIADLSNFIGVILLLIFLLKKK
jgi:signal peptidase II